METDEPLLKIDKPDKQKMVFLTYKLTCSFA